MAQQGNYRGPRSIALGAENAPRTVILFHGYTGSTDDFDGLLEVIAEKLDARVVVPLLPGHGTRVEDLLPFDFESFLQTADTETARIAQTGTPFAIGGHSFGAYLAMLTAAHYKPVGVFTTVIPYKLRFPYSSFVGRSLSRSKTLWTKHLPPDEWEVREKSFFYRQMPGKGLSLVYEGNRRITEVSAGIACPALAIHARHDTLAYPESGSLSLARIQAPTKSLVIENGRHSIFSPGKDTHTVYSTIVDFLSDSFAI